MTSVKRLDFAAGEMKPPVKMSNGWLRVDGFLTRVGVFPYRLEDGTVRRELRLPEEVFAKDALDSFALVPVTDEHPSEFLDDSNTAPLARGSVGEIITRQGDFVQARMLISDRSLIEKLAKGEARELSCGYVCDLDFTPGKTKAGEAYDAIQRNIRGNHVAVVPKGRAGPEARVRMDGVGQQVVGTQTQPPPVKTDGAGSPHHNPESHVSKVRIDGIDVEFTTEQGAQTFARFEKSSAETVTALQAKVDAAEAKATKAQAKADELQEKLTKKDEEIKGMPEKLRAEGKARAALEASARQVLGAKANFGKLDDTGVRLLTLEKLKVKIPEARATDAVYVEARFDSAMEDFDTADDDTSVKKARRAVEPVNDNDTDDTDGTETVDGDDDGDPVEAARKRMHKGHADAHAAMMKRHGLSA